MIVAVFGGNGFIGTRLVTRLLEEGNQVRLFDRSLPKAHQFTQPEHLKCFVGDFPIEKDFSKILDGCDCVFQLISTTLPNASNENAIADVEGNLIPMLRLLNQMRASGVSRLIFPSSGGTVYGEAQTPIIDEHHPTEPIVSYGATKLAIEKYLSIFQHSFGINPLCLRISNPYGPGFNPHSPQGAVGAFLGRALSDQAITIWGDGQIRRDYLFIEDLITAMVASMRYQGNESIFNISTGVGTSLLELLDLIRSVTGKAIEVRHQPSRSFDVKVNVLSNALAGQALGWEPTTPLREGIALTAQWLTQHGR